MRRFASRLLSGIRRRRARLDREHPQRAHRRTWQETRGLIRAAPYWKARLGDAVPPLEAYFVFGPHDEGGALCLYCTEPAADGSTERLDEALRRINAVYAQSREDGELGPLRQRVLPSDHPVWSSLGSEHAQEKPVLLLQRVPDARDDRPASTKSVLGDTNP